MALGNNGFNVVGALFLSQYRLGFVIFGIVELVGVLIAVLIVHEPSNLDDDTSAATEESAPAEKFSLKKVFVPWSQGRDYYLALIGKMFQGVGNFAIAGYILYILTDFLGIAGDATSSTIQLINTIMFVLSVVMGFVAGPACDKFKILKYPIALSTISLALAATSMFIFRSTAGIVAYALFAGLGMGLWNSLDNLLNLRVIPYKDRVAFFLGVYNLGNTLTQAIAPIIAAAVIGMVGYQGVFFVSIVFSLIGGICMFSIKSVKR